MKKIIEFLNKYAVIIITCLLIIVFFKECSLNSRMKKFEKRQGALIENVENKIDTLSEKTVTKTDLKIEGLKSEKRMIQSCDRKKLDMDREKEIDIELKELEK